MSVRAERTVHRLKDRLRVGWEKVASQSAG